LVLNTTLILSDTNTTTTILEHNQPSSGTPIVIDYTESSNTMLSKLLFHGLALVTTLATASPIFKRDFPNPEPISGDISGFVHDPTGKPTPYAISLESKG
jgi:hypothetical protein